MNNDARPHRVLHACVPVCRYLLVCVASAEPHLEAASDHFSEILLLFVPSPGRLAPRHSEDEGVCPWTHTLTRARCFPERAAHRATPQPCPHRHQLTPRRLPVPGLWCHPGHLPAPAGAAAAHGEGGVARSGCLLAISRCCASPRRGEPAPGGSQSPAACRGEKQKVASSHLCSPVPVVHRAQASQGENLGQGL